MPNTALITGASSGIGKELAKLCAKNKMNVVLVARHQETLETVAKELRETYHITATLIPQDLGTPGAAQRLAATLKERGIEIDVLMNNAGFGCAGPFAEIPLETQSELLTLNIVTLTELTRLLLPHMIEKKEGRILNVASTAAFQPGPFMATYYASKAYVLSFSEALSEELRGTSVTATALCPGPTPTLFAQRAQLKSALLFRSVIPKLSAEKVARLGYNAMMRGKRVVITGVFNTLIARMAMLTPQRIILKITRYLNKDR